MRCATAAEVLTGSSRHPDADPFVLEDHRRTDRAERPLRSTHDRARSQQPEHEEEQGGGHERDEERTEATETI